MFAPQPVSGACGSDRGVPGSAEGGVRRFVEVIQSDFSEPCRVLHIGLPTGKMLDEERIHEMDLRDAFEDCKRRDTSLPEWWNLHCRLQNLGSCIFNNEISFNVRSILQFYGEKIQGRVPKQNVLQKSSQWCSAIEEPPDVEHSYADFRRN